MNWRQESILSTFFPAAFTLANALPLNFYFTCNTTECVTDLDYWIEMIIFGLILTTYDSSSIFGGSWGSTEDWLEPKTEPQSGNLACPNLWNALSNSSPILTLCSTHCPSNVSISLLAQKLLMECWLNWNLVPILSIFVPFFRAGFIRPLLGAYGIKHGAVKFSWEISWIWHQSWYNLINLDPTWLVKLKLSSREYACVNAERIHRHL